MSKSGISYCDETWNVTAGCTKVSPGCENCWACELTANRLDRLSAYHGLAHKTEGGHYQWTGEVRLLEKNLDQPLDWRKPRVVFVNSQSDLFHESVPDEYIDRVLEVAAITPWHQYLILTKRPERMLPYFTEGETPVRLRVALGASSHWPNQLVKALRHIYKDDRQAIDDGDFVGRWPLPNVILGVTAENQEEADRRIPILLQTPAAKRWLSIEPMLGPMDLRRYLDVQVLTTSSYYPPLPDTLPKLDFVVVGCESGPNARPMEIDWVRSIRDQCVAAGVAFYFKQSAFSMDGSEKTSLVHLPYLDGKQWIQTPLDQRP